MCIRDRPKTEKNRERKRQRANRAGVGEKSQRRVADYPLHRLSNQPVFQTEIPPTASVQRTDRAKKKAPGGRVVFSNIHFPLNLPAALKKEPV